MALAAVIPSIIADKPTKCTVPQSWQSKEYEKPWVFNQIEKYMEQFVFEQALSLTLENKFNVWRRMRRMDTDAEQKDVSALTSSTLVESGTLMHNMI